MNYSEKLKDPRWQKKRLEILSRDEFTCSSCGSGSITLHVHHLSYKKGNEPWDYPDDNFTTLCENCHKVHHEIQEDINKDKDFSLLKTAALSLAYIAIYDDKNVGICVKIYGDTLLATDIKLINKLVLEFS